MARPKKVKSEVSSEIPENKIGRLEVALGVFKENDDYYIAEVLYDPVTGDASLEDAHRAGRTKAEASERFKIEVVKKGLI